MKKDIEWIDVNKRLPTLNGEYLVVWDLKDGEHPCVTSMDFDVNQKCFTDPRGTEEPLEMSEILLWHELPKAPKINLTPKKISKAIEPVSMDQMERLSYGQCLHGENQDKCKICNTACS